MSLTNTMPKITFGDKPLNYKSSNEDILLNEKKINFSPENKQKIIKLLKKNESNVFSEDNINNLIKMVSNENKEKIQTLLNKAQELKYNELIRENKEIIDELLKIKDLLQVNETRVHNSYENNVNRDTLSKSNKPNILYIITLIDVINKYRYILDESMKKIFTNFFTKLYNKYHRENIKTILKQNIKKRILTIGEESLTLIPEIYYNSIDGNIAIPSNKTNLKGSFGSAYKFSFRFNKYILKKIKDIDNSEFKSLIFNICLLALLLDKHEKNKENDNFKYLCNLYEFGKIEGLDNEFYAIMEYGGIDLNKYNFPDTELPENYKSNLYNVLTIIKECAKAIKVLHDIGIIHLDIKLQNFLIIEKDEEYHIKIIDFGFCIKDGTNVNTYSGTNYYFLPDYINQLSKGIKHTITKKNDIYGLGITFLRLLIKILLNNDNKYKLFHTFYQIDYIINILKLKLKLKLKYKIKYFYRNKKEEFIDKLNFILKMITYQHNIIGYTDLSYFINDIDSLQSMLKYFQD
jgi:hypothetical protein